MSEVPQLYILDTTDNSSRLFDNFKGSRHKLFSKHDLNHELYWYFKKTPSMIVVVGNGCGVQQQQGVHMVFCPIWGQDIVWEGGELTKKGCCIIYCDIPRCSSFKYTEPLLVENYDRMIDNFNIFFKENKSIGYYTERWKGSVMSVFQLFNKQNHPTYSSLLNIKCNNNARRTIQFIYEPGGYVNWSRRDWTCEVFGTDGKVSRVVVVPYMCAIVCTHEGWSADIIYDLDSKRRVGYVPMFVKLDIADLRGDYDCQCCIL